MPFFLPERPREPNKTNKILDSLHGVLESGGNMLNKLSQSKRKTTLLEGLNNKDPEEFHRSLTRILGSDLFPKETKLELLKHAYRPRDYAPGQEENYASNEGSSQDSNYGSSALADLFGENGAQNLENASQNPLAQMQEPESYSPSKPISKAQASALPEMGKAEERARENERKEMYTRSLDANRNKDWIGAIRDKEANASSIVEKADHLLELLDKGDIDSPAFAHLANKYPIFSGLLSPDTQEFEATLSELIPVLVGEFKGRVLASEIDIALRRLPSTLRNTEEGKRQIINRLKQIAQLNAVPGQLLTELEKKYPKMDYQRMRGVLNSEIAKIDKAAIKRFNQEDEMVEITDPDTGEPMEVPRWLLEGSK